MSLESKDLTGDHVYTGNIQAAANLVAMGAKLRDPMAVTVTRSSGRPEQTLFWFHNQEIECGGIPLPISHWLHLLTCPWVEFVIPKVKGNPLEHPVAFMKAAAENRAVLVSGVKTAREQPFVVVQRGNRVAVVGAKVSEDNRRRLLAS